jgi:hypothetical protein
MQAAVARIGFILRKLNDGNGFVNPRLSGP